MVSFMFQLRYSEGKIPHYQLDSRMGAPHSQPGHANKNNPAPARNQTLVIQSVANHFTNRAIPVNLVYVSFVIFFKCD